MPAPGVTKSAASKTACQAPEKGKANKALIAVLSEGLSLKKSQIELISGATSPQKRFLIRDVTTDQLQDRIERASGG